jgi:hypothetical protein
LSTYAPQPLRAEEVRSAIYIDYEGTTNQTPTLLGVLWPETDVVRQVVFERLFDDAAHARGCQMADLVPTLRKIIRVAIDNGCVIAAWSGHELDVVEGFPDERDFIEPFRRHFRDAKALGKAWARKCWPEVEFPRDRRVGRYQLARFFPLAQYEVSPIHGAGHTGDRIRYLRSMLENREGNFESLPPGSKRKWSNLLAHNRHDCLGMRQVCQSAAHGLLQGCA